MNAQKVLDQLMRAAGRNGTNGAGNGIGSLLQGVASQLGGAEGKQGAPSTDAGRSPVGGIDVKSLLGGGALGLLIGSKRGRKIGGKALKYGALAGVGVLAWKAWQNYNTGAAPDAQAPEIDRVERLTGPAREQRSLELLQAMIMAARADGHIDAAERALLSEQINALGADDELQQWVEQQLTQPLDAHALARQADSPQAAREIYLASVAIADEHNAMERAWLDELATALGLAPELARELEHQVASVR